MTTTSTNQIQWGFPNFGAATKAHAFAGAKSLCGRHDRGSVIVLSPDTGERHPHVDCARCAERVACDDEIRDHFDSMGLLR